MRSSSRPKVRTATIPAGGPDHILQRRLEVQIDWTNKEREHKEDGRYIIFYEFEPNDERGEKNDPGEDAASGDGTQ